MCRCPWKRLYRVYRWPCKLPLYRVLRWTRQMPLRPVVCLFLALFAGVPAPAQSIFSQVDTILQSLSGITGWKVQRKVPSEILRKDDFRKMVEEGVKDAETNKETRAAEITLKMFGLVPQD